MWRGKRLIFIVVTLAVILAGTIGGAVLAADDGNESEVDTRHETLLDRVCDIYFEKTGITIDQDVLKDTFAQARSDMHAESIGKYLQSLVDQNKITQEQADDYLEWWQRRSDSIDGLSFSGRIDFRSMGGPSGMRGFGRLCAPTE